MIESVQHFASLVASSDIADRREVSHGVAPIRVWAEIVDGHPELRPSVALNNTLPLQVLAVLASDPDARVRTVIAMKRRLSPQLFQRLARDVDDGVRLRVVRNPKVPADVLASLLDDPWDEVREHARRGLERCATSGPGQHDDPPSP